jgi:hypothetical protein
VFQGEMPGYSYGRQGNPTATALESKVTLHQQRQIPGHEPSAHAAVKVVPGGLGSVVSMVQRREYAIDEAVTDRAEAEAVCAAVIEVLRPVIRSVRST